MAVITYCIEYAQSQNSKCQKCTKIIPNKSLRCGRMERDNEKQKKKFARYFWYHFKCFEVPEIWTQVPVALIRGQPELLDKDKVRLERIIKLGAGGSWEQIIQQHNKKTRDDEAAARAEAEARGEEYVPPVSKKRKAANDDDDDDDEAGDFTTALTGEVDKKTERKNRKINKKIKAQKEQKTAADGKPHAKKGAAPSAPKETVTTKAIAASRAGSKALLGKLKKKPAASKA
ncbi:hypothetical protein DFQ27_005613 [Actinomortierella ambigua]|uniref:PARP-type domain-containing protein n=1 Tax=Actinomortierella ambigua TaxID=1343610 RepID=A0A9P6UB69_9FUNG|nr:hypothetical protein DFQ26_000061 [Actinomortierella ambigua]KAG0268826.1 hypothetical protein DFQ27_005613 [Actinomortierella ambigua]